MERSWGKFDKAKGSTIADAARRETEEEIGVQIGEVGKIAVLNFYFPDISKEKSWDQQAHVFMAKE